MSKKIRNLLLYLGMVSTVGTMAVIKGTTDHYVVKGVVLEENYHSGLVDSYSIKVRNNNGIERQLHNRYPKESEALEYMISEGQSVSILVQVPFYKDFDKDREFYFNGLDGIVRIDSVKINPAKKY
ncbi:MAG: hypothetical protein Q8Q01_04395 [archaeon]|nr:hypothetical protein [archaeon]